MSSCNDLKRKGQNQLFERDMAGILQQIPDFLWVKDIKGRYVFVNAIMCERILCCDHIDTILYKTDDFFIHHEKKLGNKSILSQFPNFDENISSKIVDGFVRNKHIIIEIHQTPLLGSDGQLLGTIGSGRDITQQRGRNDIIQNIMNVGLIEWHISSKKIFFSDHCTYLIGLSPNELQSRCEEWEHRIHPDDHQKLKSAYSLFLEKDTSRIDLEYRIKHRDGKYRWIKSNTICRRTPNGQPLILISLLIDITQQKGVELKLHQINSQLEKKIVQQNIMLEKTQSALKMLMEKQEENKKDVSENIHSNIKGLVIPLIEKLRISAVSEEQLSLIGVVESNLLDIVSSFSKELMRIDISLTPTELQVADMVRKGNTNKEISVILNKSVRAVAAHRENLRKKLGLKNKKINLRTYLLSIDSK